MSPKDALNDWVHTPLGGFLAYHAWWSFVAVVKLPVSLIFLGFSFVYEGLKLLFGNKTIPRQQRSTKLVVISGCDSGFGRELAILLSKRCGYMVLAGCLKDESQDALKKVGGDNMYTATLDVTKDESVETFMKVMEKIMSTGGSKKLTLHALVNNAGVANEGPVDWLDLRQYKFDMEVNYFGVVRLTKACLPFMKDLAIANRGSSEAAPRIINITSVAGLLPSPFISSYCGSKHAAEAFTSSLRMELKSWGIPVCTFNPSFHRTPMVAGGTSTLIRCWKGVDDKKKAEYGEAYVESLAQENSMVEWILWNPTNVTNQLEDAVSKYKPRSQYLVGLDARCVFPIARMLPTWMMELMVTLTLKFTLPKPAILQ